MADDETVAEVMGEGAPTEAMDIMQALQLVLKKSLAHDGLRRGLHETTKAIESGKSKLCLLGTDCSLADYSKLITALCQEKNVPLISVPSCETLGEWSGLCKIDAEGNPRKKMKCACVVVTVRSEMRGAARPGCRACACGRRPA